MWQASGGSELSKHISLAPWTYVLGVTMARKTEEAPLGHYPLLLRSSRI